MTENWVLDQLYEITYIWNPRLKYADFIDEWDRFRRNVLLPIYRNTAKEPEMFIKRVHQYFRVEHQLNYERDSWDFLTALIEKDSGNCVCTTFLLILSAYTVGLFPFRFSIGYTHDHLFIITSDKQLYFETTILESTDWKPISCIYELYNLIPPLDSIGIVDTVEGMVSYYTIHVASECIRKDRETAAIQLLSTYLGSNYLYPEMYLLQIDLTDHEDINQVLDLGTKFIESIKEQRVVAIYIISLDDLIRTCIQNYLYNPESEDFTSRRLCSIVTEIMNMYQELINYNPHFINYYQKGLSRINSVGSWCNLI